MIDTSSEPSFSALLDSLTKDGDGQFSTVITENWMQGRTTYGGLSAALCLKTIELEFQDLAPLRTAQVNFIGPCGGEISIKTKVLRQGRSVSYISAEMFSEKGLATHVIFCFGGHRESRLNAHYTETPKVAKIEDSEPFFSQDLRPVFVNNYEALLARGGQPISGSTEHEHFLWTRHKDTQAIDMAALIGIADMAPPAVLPMFKEFAPISTMTWTLNFLSEDIQTNEGWWLQRSAAEHACNGYSSQDMQIWNSSGKLVVSGLQHVAIFY